MASFRWIWLGCLLMISPAPLAADEIELMYVESQDTQDIHDTQNFFAKIAAIIEDVFTATGDSYFWRELPVGRVVRAIEQNARATCAISYRNEEREKIGKFTAVIYSSQPMSGIARRDAGLEDYYDHISDLILDQSKLGGIIRLSKNLPSRAAALIDQYGDSGLVLGFSASSADMLRLIRLGRIHYMLISGDEADFYLADPEWGAETFKKIRFGNFTEPEELALLCTKATPDAWIARFNAAITEMRTVNP